MGGRPSKSKEERLEREKRWYKERTLVTYESTDFHVNEDSGISIPLVESAESNRKESLLFIRKNKGPIAKDTVNRLPLNGFFCRYSIGPLLGEGGFSKVVTLNSKILGADFAGKVILKENVPRREYSMVRTEAAVLNHCNHPNIVHFVQIFGTIKEFVIVMELAQGEELQLYADQYVEEHKKAMEEDRVKGIIAQIGLAIEYLHQNNIVFSDLKPENVMLCELDTMKPHPQWGDERDFAVKGRKDFVKLVDFGCAAILSPSEDRVSVFRATKEYASPEQLEVAESRGDSGEGEKPTYAKPTDIWGLGVIMFFLLGGYPPFLNEKEEVTQKMIKKGDPGYIDKFWNSVSPVAQELLESLFEVKEENRPNIQIALGHPWFDDIPEEMRSNYAKVRKERKKK